MFSKLCLALCVVAATAEIDFTRTINTVPAGSSGTLTVSPGCTKTDKYGCAAGSVTGWGSSLTIAIDATLGAPITKGSTFSVDAKVDGLIPFSFSCPLCGANCTIKIPVVGKTVSFPLPPCPIASGALKKTLTVALPAKSPIPVKTSVKGSASAKDASGATLASVSFTATIGPSAVTVDTTEILTLTERTDMSAAEFLVIAAAANQTHYGCAPCMSDEVSIQIQGVTGPVCVPKCTGTTCPTDKPAGASATPQCALQSSTGDKYCALICSPSAEALSFPAFKKAADAQCGTNASCKAIQTVGICTYDD